MRAARRQCNPRKCQYQRGGSISISVYAMVWLFHEKPHPEWRSVLFFAEIKGRVASLTYSHYRQSNVLMSALLCEVLFAEPSARRLYPNPETEP